MGNIIIRMEWMGQMESMEFMELMGLMGTKVSCSKNNFQKIIANKFTPNIIIN